MSITGTAAGHPNIRATHGKTLELAREQQIGPRATCVVAVATRLDDGALVELHGRVELTLAAGAAEERVRGRLNPAFQPGDPLIVRRADAVTRDALVVGADRSAADLSRSFVAELAQPGARVDVRVETLAGEPGPGVLVVRSAEPASAPVDPAAVAEALAAGGRVEIAADEGGRRAIRAAHDAGHTVIPAPGLPLPVALSAVGGLAAGAELITGVQADQLERRLKATGAGRGAVVLDPGTPREQYLPWCRGHRLEIPGARGRTAAFATEAYDAATGSERAAAMAAGGASTRDVAQVLREDAGLPRRRAYELALSLTAEMSSVSRREPRTSR